MTAAIRIIEGPEGESESVVIDLTEDVVTIGRAMEAHVRITDPLSSRLHCQIEREGARHKIVDLESQNGTMVNGRKVNVKFLEDGDRIEIGETAIVFEAEPKDPKPRLKPMRRRRSRRRPKVRKFRPRGGGGEGVELDERLAGVLEEIGRQLGPEGLEEAESIFQDYVDRGEGGRFRRMLEEMEKASKLVDIAKAVNSERSLKRLLNLILDEAIRLTEAERGFLVLVEEGAFRFESARNFDRESVRKPEYKISRSIAEQVAGSGSSLVAADAQEDARFQDYVSVSELRLRSLVCVPLKKQKRVVGVVYLDNRFRAGVFTEEDLRTLEAFGDLAAIALENARLNDVNAKRAQELAEAKEEMEKLNALLQKRVAEQGRELERAREALQGREAGAEEESSGEDAGRKYADILGTGPAMQKVYRLLDRVTASEAPVFIQGESGTGKELVALAIHKHGKRREKSFVSENCAAIPETLLESELFGYKRGAFTGAVADKKGLFEAADGGTLFLDEIADMSPAMQKKLLRALQNGEIRPVGGKEVVKVDVRLIAASNKDLRLMAAQGSFREDLFYRINVLTVHLPPLRDRREDIPLLVEHFLSLVKSKSGGRAKRISPEAMDLLEAYHWPGSIRELENEIYRAYTLGEETIGPRDFSPSVQQGRRPLKEVINETVEKVERDAILRALREAGGKKAEAARILDVSRPTLDAKIEALGIRVDKKA